MESEDWEELDEYQIPSINSSPEEETVTEVKNLLPLDKRNVYIITSGEFYGNREARKKSTFTRFSKVNILNIKEHKLAPLIIRNIVIKGCDSKIYLDTLDSHLLKILRRLMPHKKILPIRNDELERKLTRQNPLEVSEISEELSKYVGLSDLDEFMNRNIQPVISNPIYSFQLHYYNPTMVEKVIVEKSIVDLKDFNLKNLKSISGIKIKSIEDITNLKYLQNSLIESISLEIIDNFEIKIDQELIEALKNTKIKNLQLVIYSEFGNKQKLTQLVIKIFPDLIKILGNGVFTELKSEKIQVLEGEINQTLSNIPNLRELKITNYDPKIAIEIATNSLIDVLSISSAKFLNGKESFKHVTSLTLNIDQKINAIDIVEKFPNLRILRNSSISVWGKIYGDLSFLSKLEFFKSLEELESTIDNISIGTEVKKVVSNKITFPPSLKYLNAYDFKISDIRYSVDIKNLDTLIRTGGKSLFETFGEFPFSEFKNLRVLDLSLSVGQNLFPPYVVNNLKFLSLLIREKVEEISLFGFEQLESLALYLKKNTIIKILVPKTLTELEIRYFDNKSHISINPNNIRTIRIKNKLDSIKNVINWIIKYINFLPNLRSVIIQNLRANLDIASKTFEGKLHNLGVHLLFE